MATKSAERGENRKRPVKGQGAGPKRKAGPKRPRPAPDDPRTKPRRPGKTYEDAAGQLLEDGESAVRAADEAEAKARRNRNALETVWEDLVTMIRLVRAYADGSYREIPWGSIVMALGAVLYLLSPVDAIPDFLAVVGFLDDAAVIGFVARKLHDDLETFREWELGRAQNKRVTGKGPVRRGSRHKNPGAGIDARPGGSE